MGRRAASLARIDHESAGAKTFTISVVIPNRNDAAFLAPCLEALRAQHRPADEIIVVDNESVDDSRAVAERFGVTLLTQTCTGVWPTAARGFDAARGDIIARLDADSVAPADWLSHIEAAFARDPSLSAVTGTGTFYGGNRVVRWVAEHIYIGGYLVLGRLWLGHPPVFGSNMALRREVWLELRDRVASDHSRVHDDLDLSIHLAPPYRVVLDRSLGMLVSARPFDSLRGLGRRVWRAGTTLRVSWPAGAPLRQWRRRA